METGNEKKHDGEIQEITNEEIKTNQKNVKNGKGTDPGNVPIELLQKC